MPILILTPVERSLDCTALGPVGEAVSEVVCRVVLDGIDDAMLELVHRTLPVDAAT